MNIQQAYKLLEVSDSISDDDLKKEYKKLAIKYHPDRFKDDPEKFKTINEAYQLITDHRQNPHKYERQNPFANGGGFGINLNDIINGFSRSQQTSEINVQPIQLKIEISFKESVLGVERDLSYKKNVKCDDCNGNGRETLSNGCKQCNGFGRVIQTQGNMSFSTGCNKCHGRNIKFKDCVKCSKKGYQEVETHVKINIPPGNATTLRIRGVGHYAGSSMLGDTYSDVFLSIEVEKDNDLHLDGANVIYELKISLLDAIEGCKKEVKTIYGMKEIVIPNLSKNKEEIHIPNCGVRQHNGIQIIKLDVLYPENVDDLAGFLRSH